MSLTGDKSKIQRLRKLGASVLKGRKSSNRRAQRPGPVVARPALRTLQVSVSAVLVFALTLVSMPVVPLIAPFGTPAAEAVDLPATTSSSISLQTSGPNAGLGVGDFYTTAPGSGGGGQDHLIEITVPQSWPGLPVTVALYDPEVQSPGGGSLVANDEIRGTADTATFTLHDLTGTPIVSQTYTSGGGTNGLWTELVTFTPAGPGTYRLFASTSDNDDNAWRLRVVTDPDCATGCSSAELDDGDETDNPDGIAGSGDELKVGVQRSTFQHVGAGLVCNEFYFFVDGLQTSIALHNFGMDSVAGASVTYTLPDGSTQPGTVSADSRWNGSTNTTRVGDIFSVDSSRVGWWKATICLDSATQYIFEGIQGKPVYLGAIPLRPQLTLTKDDGSATAAVGDTITYDLTISNTSTGVSAGAARQIVLRDTLPNGVNFVSGSFAPGITGGVSHASGVVTFVFDQALPAGSSTTVQVTAQVVAPSGNTITNTARVLWKDGLGNQYPPVIATDVDTLTGTDLGVAKGVDNAIPNVGETVVFTVNVTHFSGDPATGVVVNDKLPIGLSYQSHTASVGTYDNVTGDWTVGAIGAGGTVTLTITANVVGSSGVYNIAEITAADQFDPDSTPGNSSTTEDDYALVNLAVGGGGTVCWLVADNGSPQTNGNDLLTVFANGVETFIDTGGASGTGTTAIESIAFQPVTEILYAANGGQFGSINTATGEFVAIGPGGLGDVDGMAFDLITLKLYGAQRLGGNDRLIEINPATGTIVAGAFGGADFLVIDTLAAVGVGDIDDFAIDPVDNRLYGIANDAGTQDRLVLVDRTTGAVTDIGSTAPAQDLEGLSFDNAGTLFATTGTSSELLQLDKATGAPVAGTAVGLAYGDYESVDCDTNGFNTIAGTVFLDQNSDGILNGSDTGTQNVTVRIYRDDDGSGTISAGDPVVGTKVTDSGGGYL
ncbi:MAG: DUF11 domain-containing protein, partial [Acidimicrobiales bacterium]|nr:DUF11 domain-containing protein [Acidimicrobiales bacterium]